MWVIIVVFLIGFILILLEVPSIWRREEKKELLVFSILLVIGIGLNVAKELNWNILNPLDVLIFIYKPISDFVMSLLK
ncbi:hypothetical protein [Gracilibacillus suaedae]|uniref:hypothetical protein n=1 Tax=Gracilibacillus suaedae TaxID=2820273 RepID=UPI001ABDFB32|nr:hypothetical protein [Gracilibacillus suaedae]